MATKDVPTGYKSPEEVLEFQIGWLKDQNTRLRETNYTYNAALAIAKKGKEEAVKALEKLSNRVSGVEKKLCKSEASVSQLEHSLEACRAHCAKLQASELERSQQTHQAECTSTLAEVKEHVVNLTEALSTKEAQ